MGNGIFPTTRSRCRLAKLAGRALEYLQGRVFYVSEFGSALKPLEKDGKGRISQVSLTG